MISHLCAVSGIVVRSGGGAISVAGMIGEAAARCLWRAKDASTASYSGLRPEHLADAQSPQEILSIARERGCKDDHPHITDALARWPAHALARVDTDQLRWSVSWLSDDYKLVVVSLDDKGLTVSGVPLGGCTSAHVSLVFRSPVLKRVFKILPSGQQAKIGLMEHKGEVKAIRISIDGWPREEYYLPVAWRGLLSFVA